MKMVNKLDWIGIEEKAKNLYCRLKNCDLCPRECRVNRLEGKSGYCGMAKDLLVYTAFLHQGEEPTLSGRNGSGTIFFSGCNLKCSYCQNYKFSHFRTGKVVSEKELAGIMLNLEKKGAHNINLVTPTHFLPQILNALSIALKNGLSIPLVYNTSGYEKPAIIRELKGVVDIYLPDLKYTSSADAAKYSRAPDYPLLAREAIKEMYRQQSKNAIQNNLHQKGLIIRHLVIPGHTPKSKAALFWIKQNTPRAFLSLMFQYQPYHQASAYPEINRKITYREYTQINRFLRKLGLQGWVQELNTQEELAGVYFNPAW